MARSKDESKEKNLGGRPRAYTVSGYTETEYDNQATLKEKIDEYFNICAANGDFPDEAGMRVFLGVSKDTIERYLSNEGNKYSGFAAVIKNARDRRESLLQRDIYKSESKDATGKIFLSKQLTNGGLSDKQEMVNDVKISLQLNGNDSKLLG